MKRTVLSIITVMLLVLVTTVPAVAATGTETASVTVNQYINTTLYDMGVDGVGFGSLNPGTTDTASTDQSTTGTPAESGTADGGGTSTSLTEAGQNFQTTVDVGMIAYNVTDASTAYVTAVGSDTSITTTALSGGTDDFWESGDSYYIYSGALAYYVASDTNVAVYNSIKGDGANFENAGVTETFAVTNASWDVDDGASGATNVTTSYAQVGSQITAGTSSYVNLWHWIDIPGGQAADSYDQTFTYKTDTSV